MRPSVAIAERLRRLDEAQLRRAFTGDVRAVASGEIDTRSNDYLGLAGAVSRETSPEAQFAQALGAGAARLVSGTTAEHVDLEGALSGWLGTEEALLFSSAYAANLGVLASLGERGDVIFSDALNHASIIDGCRLSRAEIVVYPHLDVDAVVAALDQRRGQAGQRWVVTESYFGMDGNCPDLARLRAVCDEHDAGLIVDEAHALGVFGPEGRGLCAAAGMAPEVLVGGFGKALGAQGGFVAGARVFVEWFWNRARTFVFSTATSPTLTRAVLGRLAGVRADDAGRERLRALEGRLERRLLESGVILPPGRVGPIFPVVLGDERAVLDVSEELRREGIRVQAIRPPTVPAGSSRLRVIVRADMTEQDVEVLGGALVGCLARRGYTAGSFPREAEHERVEPGMTAAVRGNSAAPQPPADPSGSALGAHPARDEKLGVAGAEPRDERGAALVWRPTRRGHSDGEGEWKESGAPEEAAPIGAATGRGPQPHLADVTASAGGGTSPQHEDVLGVAGAPPDAPQVNRDRFLPGTWVVLGTGTGVGKTHVAVGLVKALAQRGPVAGLKPIETGVTPVMPGMTDAAALDAVSFHVKRPSPHPLYAFTEPVTPSLAARRERRSIDTSSVRAWLNGTRTIDGSAPPSTVIETAGGVFSPLGPGLDNYDLALQLGPARWVLVAMDRLGVLHEVASTLRAMAALGRMPDFIVLNAPAEPDASTGTNLAELREMGVTLPILRLGRDEHEPLSQLVAGADTPHVVP